MLQIGGRQGDSARETSFWFFLQRSVSYSSRDRIPAYSTYTVVAVSCPSPGSSAAGFVGSAVESSRVFKHGRAFSGLLWQDSRFDSSDYTLRPCGAHAIYEVRTPTPGTPRAHFFTLSYLPSHRCISSADAGHFCRNLPCSAARYAATAEAPLPAPNCLPLPLLLLVMFLPPPCGHGRPSWSTAFSPGAELR